MKEETKKQEENIVIETDTKDIIEQYFNDEDNKKRLDELAIYFNKVSKGNWITVTKLITKSMPSIKPNVKMFLDLLIMSKRAFVKKVGETLMYKITLDKELRKKILTNQIIELEKTIEIYKSELAEIK